MKKISFLLLLFSISIIASNKLYALSHSKFDNLLVKHVNPNGIVNYKGFLNDREKLGNYLTFLESNPPSSGWSNNEKMTFWINAYNAFTIKLIIDNYPVQSITKINEGKPWDLAFIKIGDKSYTLNNIENDILRKEFSDARIHFAINCASVSCPKLLNEAYEANKLESQLTKVTRDFLSHSKKNTLSANEIEISKIFNWFKDDFEPYGGVISFINKYSSVKVNPNATIAYKDYNWNLNS